MSEFVSLLTLNQLVSSVRGQLFDSTVTEIFFSSVATDSRQVVENTLFVPLIGELQDGHKYVESAAEKGASVIFVANSSISEYSEKYQSISKKGVCLIIVENTLTALQQAASCYVSQFPSLIKVGITGSSGKTTTKELVASVLKQHFDVVMTEGNLNSETGLPLSVFKISTHHQVGVFEMGMNRKGEISELAAVLFPDFGIITNIGTAHIGILGTKDQIAHEKKQIFSHFSEKSIGFVPETDSYASFLAEGVKGTIKTFGLHSMPTVTNVQNLGIKGTSFFYKNRSITLSLPGKYNFYDCLAAIAIGEELGLSSLEIKQGIENIHSLFGRSNIIEGTYTLVEDCYNANFESMLAAISFCQEMNWTGRKHYVLGDMLELGESSQEIHQKVISQLLQTKEVGIVLIGPEMVSSYKGLNETVQDIVLCSELDDESVGKACIEFSHFLKRGDMVLIKGSRGIHLERVSKFLSEDKTGGNRG